MFDEWWCDPEVEIVCELLRISAGHHCVCCRRVPSPRVVVVAVGVAVVAVARVSTRAAVVNANRCRREHGLLLLYGHVGQASVEGTHPTLSYFLLG